jgi:hypothetical protein
MDTRNEEIPISGLLKLSISIANETTTITVGRRVWRLVLQKKDYYILMDNKLGKVRSFEMEYKKAYKKCLEFIYDVIISSINYDFNTILNINNKEEV